MVFISLGVVWMMLALRPIKVATFLSPFLELRLGGHLPRVRHPGMILIYTTSRAHLGVGFRVTLKVQVLGDVDGRTRMMI